MQRRPIRTAHPGGQPGVRADARTRLQDASGSHVHAVVQLHPGLDHRQRTDGHRGGQLRVRGDHGTRMNSGRGRLRPMQHRGDPRVSQIGIRIDQRRHRAIPRILLRQDDRGRACRAKLPAIARVGKEADGAGVGPKQRRDARHPQVRVAAQLHSEPHGQFTQAVFAVFHGITWCGTGEGISGRNPTSERQPAAWARPNPPVRAPMPAAWRAWSAKPPARWP